jgi:hypothetical protein
LLKGRHPSSTLQRPDGREFFPNCSYRERDLGKTGLTACFSTHHGFTSKMSLNRERSFRPHLNCQSVFADIMRGSAARLSVEFKLYRRQLGELRESGRLRN